MPGPAPNPVSHFPLSPTALMVLLFFFFNTFLLPSGLLYTTLLTPVFLWQLIRKQHWKPLFWYALLSLPYAILHQKAGANMGVYFRSYLLFSSTVIFIFWAYFNLREKHHLLSHHFKQITAYNLFLTVLAVPMLFVPVAQAYFWYFEPVHQGIFVIPRLKMLVYEPSFYSFLLAPIFLYYFTLAMLKRHKPAYLSLSIVGISLLLSLSFGVIGGILLAISITLAFHAKQLIRRAELFYTFFALLILAIVVVFTFVEYLPFNPVVDRAGKVLQGNDPSANARTWEAFHLAWQILEQTDYIFGAGLGQIKIVGHQIIVDYYHYQGKWADLVRIPNTTAETLATFGILGFTARFMVQIVLFVYSKVYENYYRLLLFTFVFIYQFSGSYLTNIYEYLIWVIVFLPVFPEFDQKEFSRPYLK